MIINNALIKDRVRDRYKLLHVLELETLLKSTGAFRYPALQNGLFPAAVSHGEDYEYTGYHNVWVRDNIHVAHACYVSGYSKTGINCVRTLAEYFFRHQHRFDAIINGIADRTVQMERPHIRFDGDTLNENKEEWPHIQNDALGYFVWFFCLLVNEGHIQPIDKEIGVLAKFVDYFEAIEYWQDEDSGHWEETRKVEASSIGAVLAGLEQLSLLLNDSTIKERIHALIEKGVTALRTILPAECIQRDSTKNRRYDSALLFLIYPLDLWGSFNQQTPEDTDLRLDSDLPLEIVNDVILNLGGDYGIKRYLGDSYWCADYKAKLAPEQRTGEFTGDLDSRDALLSPGEEAQWCIFDSIISCIYGRWYAASGNDAHLESQTHHFNRALGQLTAEDSDFGPLKGPESYYIENGKTVPNDITPLLWTHANLQLAFHHMKNSLSHRPV